MKKRKTYSKEFKEEAIRLVKEDRIRLPARSISYLPDSLFKDKWIEGQLGLRDPIAPAKE